MKNIKINNNKKMLYKNILYYTKKLLCFALIFMSAFVFFACDETKIENLDGTLSLSAIQITPTSIIKDDIDKFAYKNEENVDCLKISQIHIILSGDKTSQNTENALNDIIFAPKNVKTEIAINTDFSVDTCTNFAIEFGIDVYHTVTNEEQLFWETNLTKQQITKKQTNTDLVNFSKIAYGQIVYTFSNINSTNAKFSYNITFVFDFYPNT